MEEEKNKSPAEEETETVKTLLRRIADMEEAHKKDIEEKNKQMQAIMQGLKQSDNVDMIAKVQNKVKEFTRW